MGMNGSDYGGGTPVVDVWRRDWGVAIICLVVLVRLILHPLTKAGQVRMMGMQKFGPEIARRVLCTQM